MKNLLIRTTASLSIFSLSLFNAKPGLTDTYVYGSNSTRPDSLKVTFYQLGLTNSDFTKVFSVLNSESGVEVDISDQNSINNMATGVTPIVGTYTHLYALVDNTYKMKGSANGCYTKNTSVNQSNGVFDAANSTVNGATFCTNCDFDGWSAATSNSAEFGEASLREQTYCVGNDGEPDCTDGYGPVIPSTNIAVGGNEVLSAKLYYTNSTSPYSIIPEGIKNIEEVESQIRADLKNEKAKTAAFEEANKILIDISSGENQLAELIKSKKGLEGFKNETKKLSQGFTSIGRSNYITGAIASTSLGKTIGPIETKQGYAILQVNEISKFDSVAFQNQKDQLVNTLFSKKQNQYFQAWLSDLKDQAEIIDNRKYYF